MCETTHLIYFTKKASSSPLYFINLQILIYFTKKASSSPIYSIIQLLSRNIKYLGACHGYKVSNGVIREHGLYEAMAMVSYIFHQLATY